MVAAILRKSADEMQGRQIWIRFATWILLALEFALAADLVRTAVAPTWDDIAKLAVIATIRTMLNYFLAKDIAEFEPVERSGGSPCVKYRESSPPRRPDRRRRSRLGGATNGAADPRTARLPEALPFQPPRASTGPAAEAAASVLS